MKKNNTTRSKIVGISLLALSLIVIGSSAGSNKTLTKRLDTTAVEITYKAESPLGLFGGVALPASCESNAWNANNGYHLDGVTADPGNCAAVIPVAPATTTPAVNNPPQTPVISGDEWAIVNQTTSNWIVSTDPEGDAVFYELDWDCNGSIDGTTNPATGSGVSTPIGHTYATVGTKSVCGYAVQANDTTKRSGQGTYTIRVTNGTCTAPANACGVTNGTVSGGQCVAPGLPAGYGTSCSSAANICGMRDATGTIDCSGSCSGVVVPSNTLCACTSGANSCGMTNNGFYNAAGNTCGAVTPPNSACPVVPVAPGPGPAAPAATINDFRASPRLIAVNKTSRLYWDITGNISSCTISYTTNTSPAPVQVTSNLGANIGNLETSPVSEKRYYKLKCGAAEREAIVSVFSLTEI